MTENLLYRLIINIRAINNFLISSISISNKYVTFKVCLLFFVDFSSLFIPAFSMKINDIVRKEIKVKVCESKFTNHKRDRTPLKHEHVYDMRGNENKTLTED